MDAERALKLVREMVEIESYSGREGALARHLVAEMRALGFESQVDEAGNAVGVVGDREGPEVMLLGHLDTVSGRIPVRQVGRELHGRGSVDAKGSLAAFVAAASRARDCGARLVVVGAVEEETAASRGAHHLLDRHRPAAVVIGEPSGWDSVVLGYKGRLSLVYEVTRPRSHSSRIEETAVELAIGFWNRVCESLGTDGDGARVFDRPTPSVRSLVGDPEHARLELSCRTPLGFDAEAFGALAGKLAGDGELVLEEVTPAVLVDRSNPVVRSLLGAIRGAGAEPRLKVKTGTSDMNVVREAWDVPMAAYGPGDSSLDHTPEERLDLDEYLHAVDVLADALPRLAAGLRPAAPAAAPVPAPAPAGPAAAESVFSEDEEAELTERLQALGYLE